jgi:hypothetical protein
MKFVAISLPSQMGRVQLRISDTGELSWTSPKVGEALEYEEMLAAMSGVPSLLGAFTTLWRKNIREAMFGLLPTKEHKALLAMDCAEHAVQTYVTEADWHDLMIEVVVASRDFIRHIRSKSRYRHLVKAARNKEVSDDLTEVTIGDSFMPAGESFLDEVVNAALWSRHSPHGFDPWTTGWSWVTHSDGEGGIKVLRPASVSVLACDLAAAMGPRAKPGPANSRWREEKAWQIRRFVDVLPTTRKRHPWPELEETP